MILQGSRGRKMFPFRVQCPVQYSVWRLSHLEVPAPTVPSGHALTTAGPNVTLAGHS